MPQGIQVFDANGNVVLDTSTRVLKRSTELSFTANTTAVQSVPIPSGSSTASVIAVPVTSGVDASAIQSYVSGGNLNYAARIINGASYKLNVVFF